MSKEDHRKLLETFCKKRYTMVKKVAKRSPKKTIREAIKVVASLHLLGTGSTELSNLSYLAIQS